MAHVHPEAARRAALRADPAAPAVTFYDIGAGERVELSAATLDNWVAKVANLLTFEYDLGPGDRVQLALPLHWQVPVFASALWGVGATVVLGPVPAHDVALIVTTAEAAQPEPGPEVLAVSLHPLGLPLGDGCPSWADDALSTVRGQPDVANLVTPDPESIVISTPHVHLTGVQAMALVSVPELAHRVMTTMPPSDPIGLLNASAALMLAPGGGVLAVGGDPASLAALAAQERVDATLPGRPSG